METRTNIEQTLPSCHRMAGAERAFDLFDVAEIFKKTSCVADLKPAGRDVANNTFETDAVNGILNVNLTDAVLAERKTEWQPRETNHRSGALSKYAQQVRAAVGGAVTHPGGAYEKQCYANI